ncbi:alcohol dehydrogenase [Mycobacterium marinum]|uniref:zinc-binding dehydrogenase n=1 Tax=Mycobacterium marinum TaxID=1781 RepID=UPI0021C27CF3|nr:zinc-binding dehydrogenase [Mycobacterium marinum]GJN98358.1 alcohol dehydrogenase [Mycobacterium marinum]GJO01892.1 alcohol dehydrogenase [Mycobacterium marinum]GJO03053.1 alcohol dehydrogenase [Mycobacterium marinum]GJO20714.1 alcohol dehydrogenase [Mycobacterium marinum]GJO27496.1 alcohol dehydrogenase [Mycobacterium marinum]
MRAVLMQDSKLQVAEVPEPVPGPGEVLVDVLACGICGSDLHCAAHGPEFNAATQAAGGFDMMDLSRPVVFGHEFVGRIAAYGPDTDQRIPVGRRVVSAPFLLREQKVTLGFAGPEAPGGYSERMLLSEPLLIEVPDHVPTEVAALTEPLAVAYRTVARVDTSTDDVALVVGCGPIGLAVIAVLKMKGVGPIVASDFSPERRALAAQLGADVVLDPNENSPFEAFMAAAVTDDPARMAPAHTVFGQLPLRPTVAFDCVGVPGLIQQLIAGVPPGTRIGVPGINMSSDHFEPAQCIAKELDIRFSLYYTLDEFAQTFAHLAAGDFDVAPLLTGTVALEGVADAFERLRNNPHDAKILLDPTR